MRKSVIFIKIFWFEKNIYHKEKQNNKKGPFIFKYVANAATRHLMAVIPANNRLKHSEIRFTCRKMMHFI